MYDSRVALPIEPQFTYIPNQSSLFFPETYREFAWWLPYSELETKFLFNQIVEPNWVIFDIGANIGMHTILFSKLASSGMVFAFEPTSTYTMLINNIQFHNLKNIQTYKMAVGSEPGTYNATLWKLFNVEVEQNKYDFISIDDFVSKKELLRIDLLKIDTDGYEESILMGALYVLRHFKPFIIIETSKSPNSGQNFEKIKHFLENLRFQIVDQYDGNNILFAHVDKSTLRLKRFKIQKANFLINRTSISQAKTIRINFLPIEASKKGRPKTFKLDAEPFDYSCSAEVPKNNYRILSFTGFILGARANLLVTDENDNPLLMIDLSRGIHLNTLLPLMLPKNIPLKLIIRSSNDAKYGFVFFPVVHMYFSDSLVL